MFDLTDLLPFISSFVILLHHRVKHGYWIDFEDVNNHETVALFLLGIGIGMFIG